MNQIDLYNRLFTEEEVRELLEIRKSSLRLFRIGDMADAKLAEFKNSGIPQFLILDAIGKLAGIGGRRVEKLRQISKKFPPEIRDKYQDLPMSHFEMAYDYPNSEEAMLFLDFAKDAVENDTEWISTENIGRAFRSDILGLEVTEPPAPPPLLLEQAARVAEYCCDSCGKKTHTLYRVCTSCYNTTTT